MRYSERERERERVRDEERERDGEMGRFRVVNSMYIYNIYILHKKHISFKTDQL